MWRVGRRSQIARKKKKKGRYVDPAMERVTTVRSRPLDFILEEGSLVDWPLPITSISEKDIVGLTAQQARPRARAYEARA